MAERFMEPDKVRVIAKGFETASTTLKAVSTVLKLQIDILNATAFIGLVGGTAVAQYLEVIQPQIEKLAKITGDMSQEISHSVQLWEQAQQAGAMGTS